MKLSFEKSPYTSESPMSESLLSLLKEAGFDKEEIKLGHQQQLQNLYTTLSGRSELTEENLKKSLTKKLSDFGYFTNNKSEEEIPEINFNELDRNPEEGLKYITYKINPDASEILINDIIIKYRVLYELAYNNYQEDNKSLNKLVLKIRESIDNNLRLAA